MHSVLMWWRNTTMLLFSHAIPFCPFSNSFLLIGWAYALWWRYLIGLPLLLWEQHDTHIVQRIALSTQCIYCS